MCEPIFTKVRKMKTGHLNYDICVALGGVDCHSSIFTVCSHVLLKNAILLNLNSIFLLLTKNYVLLFNLLRESFL